MITQKYKNGNLEIRVESAESVEDAKKNGFAEGQFCRYYINGKPCQAYGEVVAAIIKSSRESREKFVVPSQSDLKKMQSDMMKKHIGAMKKEIENIKKTRPGLPAAFFSDLESMVEKIDLVGARVRE